MFSNFELSIEDQNKVEKWLSTTVYPAVIAEQKAGVKNPSIWYTSSWEEGYPYEGAIGGGLTYSFTPNSIAMVIKVKYKDFELDLSDYESW